MKSNLKSNWIWTLRFLHSIIFLAQNFKLNETRSAKLKIQLKSNWIFSKLWLYIYIVGPRNLTTPAHFILSPRPTPRREKWPRTNKESPNSLETLPRTILLSASQIPGGKSSTPAKAASQSTPRRRISTVRHPWVYGVGTIQEETVISALNAPN